MKRSAYHEFTSKNRMHNSIQEVTVGKDEMKSGNGKTTDLQGSESREERLRRHQQNLAALRRMQVQVAEWESRASFDGTAAKSLAQVEEVLKSHRLGFERLRVQLSTQLEHKKTKRSDSAPGPLGMAPAAKPRRLKRYV